MYITGCHYSPCCATTGLEGTVSGGVGKLLSGMVGVGGRVPPNALLAPRVDIVECFGEAVPDAVADGRAKERWDVAGLAKIAGRVEGRSALGSKIGAGRLRGVLTCRRVSSGFAD